MRARVPEIVHLDFVSVSTITMVDEEELPARCIPTHGTEGLVVVVLLRGGMVQRGRKNHLKASENAPPWSLRRRRHHAAVRVLSHRVAFLPENTNTHTHGHNHCARRQCSVENRSVVTRVATQERTVSSDDAPRKR